MERRSTVDRENVPIQWHSETSTSCTGVLRALRVSGEREDRGRVFTVAADPAGAGGATAARSAVLVSSVSPDL
ncbi:MAG TPA: hypothetical protein VFZ92_14780 [Umezawaea sp.]